MKMCIRDRLNDMFERDKKNSTLLTPEVWKKRSGWKKFVGWVGNLMKMCIRDRPIIVP